MNHGYATSIIPRQDYIRELNLCTIIPKHDFGILRRIKGTGPLFDVLNGQKVLKHSALDPCELPDMSMNILSVFFPKDAYRFNQEAQAKKPWAKEFVRMKDFKGCIVYKSDTSFIVFQASELNNQEIDYPRKFSSKDEYDALPNAIKIGLDAFSRANTYPLKALITLTHKPTKTNYWHITLNVAQFKGAKAIKNTSSSWKKKMCEVILTSYLRFKAKEENSLPLFPLYLCINPKLSARKKFCIRAKNLLINGINTKIEREEMRV